MADEVKGFGDHPKRINHPEVGWLSLDYSAFAVDGRPDLQLVIYNPATPEDVAKVKRLVEV